MNDDLTALAKNPLFQMSLGSKELFHSNFLAWALGNKDQQKFTKSFFKKLLKDEDLIIDEIEPPEREKMNIDLKFKIKFPGGKKKSVIIENKVKSMPYKSQPVKYKEKFENNGEDNTFFLLSLIEPYLVREDWKIIQEDWNIINYKNIAGYLKDSLKEIKIIDDEKIPFKSLISSYIDFIQSLHEITKNVKIIDDAKFDFNKEIVLKPYRDLRIHDLFLKLTYQQIAMKIEMKVGGADLMVFSDWNEFKKCEGGLYIGTGFTRGTSLIEFKYNLKKLDNSKDPLIVALGVQLQGNMFKYIIELSGKSIDSYTKSEIQLITDKIANELLEEKKWLCSASDLSIEENIFEEGKIKGNGKSRKEKFNNYNNTFIYKYDVIPEGTKISQVLSLFEGILKYILDNRRSFIEVIEKTEKAIKI